jgi:hypothetical protein
MFDETNTCQ